MKIIITMKTPDIMEEIGTQITAALPEDAEEGLVEDMVEKLRAKWFKYGEYLAVEIDIEKGTCVGIPLK